MTISGTDKTRDEHDYQLGLQALRDHVAEYDRQRANLLAEAARHPEGSDEASYWEARADMLSYSVASFDLSRL